MGGLQHYCESFLSNTTKTLSSLVLSGNQNKEQVLSGHAKQHYYDCHSSKEIKTPKCLTVAQWEDASPHRGSDVMRPPPNLAGLQGETRSEGQMLLLKRTINASKHCHSNTSLKGAGRGQGDLVRYYVLFFVELVLIEA